MTINMTLIRNMTDYELKHAFGDSSDPLVRELASRIKASPSATRTENESAYRFKKRIKL